MSEEYKTSEEHCIDKILDLLHGLDGMTDCQCYGILECVKQSISEKIHLDTYEHPEY